MGKRKSLITIIGLVILVGLFYLVKPKNSAPEVTTTTSTTQAESSSSAKAINTKTFDLVVKNRKLVSGPDTLKAVEGDQITINITNDENEELHLHGYDKSVDLEASKAAQVSFTANLTGRFPFELEHSKTELGAVEVQPK